MVVQMTRAEYEQKYGVQPVLGASTSKIDTSPAIPTMTRAEYMVRYGVDPITGKPLDNRGLVGKVLTPTKEALQGLGTLYGGGEQGIAQKLRTDVTEAAKDIQQGSVVKGITKAGLRVAGDIATTIFAPIGAAIQATGFGKATEKFGQWYVDKYGDELTNNPTFQKFVVEHPNAGEDFDRALMLAMSAFDTSTIKPSTVLPRTVEQFTRKTPPPPDGGSPNLPLERSVRNTVEEIANIENNYAKLRKANEFTPDAIVSRERIAKSGVLQDAVDTTGTIRTKQKGGAVEQYRKLTLDGAEDVVRRGLETESKTTNLKDVAQSLTDNVLKSGLEGADLRAALTGITREINGLKIRADQNGNIPLVKIHDAKVNTTKNINYNTPPETATYRKTVARTYKEIVESNSSLPIREVNAELGKYLRDIQRLENLDGRKVKGGKLGVYSARIAGNIAGGAVGGMVGGMGGVALGTIVGGEVSGLLKGRSLAGTFGKIKSPEIPSSPILEQAKKGFSGSPSTKGKVESQLPQQGKLQSSGDSTIADSAYQETVKNGGVTIGLSGNKPTKGIVYAPFKNTEFQVPKNELNAKIISDYMAKHADKLSVEGNYLGMWESDGKIYLDISKVGELSPETLEGAMNAQQLAAFDLSTFTEIPLGKITNNVYNRLYEKATNHPYLNKGKDTTGSGKGATEKSSEVPSGQKKITDPSKFERAKDLPPDLKSLEDRAFDYILENEDSILQSYLKDNPKYVNADDFRPYFKEVGYTDGSLAAGVQEPVSYLAKRARAIALQNEGQYVIGTAGGSGVGKTTAGNQIPEIKSLIDDSALVLDSNFSTLKSAENFIKEVQAAGKEFRGVFTYREFLDAIENGIVRRMLTNKKEMGRVVPNKITVSNHLGSFDVIQELVKRGFDIRFVDNSLGQGKARLTTLAELKKKISYESPEKMLKQANEKIKGVYEQRKPFVDENGKSYFVTKQQYQRFIE